MELLVEAMPVVQEESREWIEISEMAVELIPLLDSSYKVQAERQQTED